VSETKGSRTGILIILDGFGVNPSPDKSFNAIAQARTPTLDRLLGAYPHTQLDASESHVGLPDGFMGNSEVGHLNIGAGRIVRQDFSLITHAIDDGTFFTNPAFRALFDRMRQQQSSPTLHLMGLVSDGGVHSHLTHLLALVRLAKLEGISRVAIHAFTDGRDTSPTSGVDFVGQVEAFCRDAGLGTVATVIGRFYSMDRDNRWDRTELAYQAIVQGKADHTFREGPEYIRRMYGDNVTDEFLPPAVRSGYKGMKDGDGVIFFNFRADRARQLTHALTDKEFSQFKRAQVPTLSGYVCMSRYDEKFDLPVAFEKPKVEETLGEVVAEQGWKQLRIAETEKYAHVTYFFNGGEEKVFPGEKRVLIPSPRDVKTYDQKPEMSAKQVTDSLLEELGREPYRFVVVNFANTDMVGHTGNLGATIRAVQTVDECVGKVVQWAESNGAFAILTADHGNCEKMQADDGTPLTSHTTFPVPFIVIDPRHKDVKLHDGGRLCDIAPTMLQLWGIKQPKQMTGKSLIEG